ncbi:hypothetical protein HDU81_008069 [Chytriomyces hyalinus]|nr:hypothetical protein HDU81_008069 [Chytriomyces hyalinus]
MNNNSSVKGKVTERKTQALLQNAFPTAMVTAVPSNLQQGRCDLELERENKRRIVVECKDYDNIVPRAEIEKFEQDVLLTAGQADGIMFAPFSTLVFGRKNMEIRSVGASFAIFVYGTGISHAELESAVQMLDTLNDHTRDNNGGGGAGALEDEHQIKIDAQVLARANLMIGAQIKRMEKIKNSLTAILKETKNSIALAQQDCAVDILSDLRSILMQGGQVDDEETESEVELLKVKGVKKVAK